MIPKTEGWKPFDSGRSLGGRGSEGGVILLDDEHVDGARITIERGGSTAPFSITCGVYGWLAHTRFFGTEAEAQKECAEMKVALTDLLGKLDECGEDLRSAGEHCSEFVERFP
ncbi:MAG TPA: hypothetical protein VFE33_27115 [Thermoanaerobaculia bacterium]|nr:hypothetical protein [Thermoanaerobaculia bacterium]